MVEHQPSKLDTWVRFPSPAYARVAQLVERDLAKVEAAGSSPVSRSLKSPERSGLFVLRKDEMPRYKVLDFVFFCVLLCDMAIYRNERCS